MFDEVGLSAGEFIWWSFTVFARKNSWKPVFFMFSHSFVPEHLSIFCFFRNWHSNGLHSNIDTSVMSIKLISWMRSNECTDISFFFKYHFLLFELLKLQSRYIIFISLCYLGGRVAWWLATCAWKPKVPGSSPAASYVQRWALCSNRPANI